MSGVVTENPPPLPIEVAVNTWARRIGGGLHAFWLCPRSVDLAHIPVVDGGNLAIVPGDRDSVPTCCGDSAAVSRITPPAYSISFLEVPGFSRRHVAPRLLPSVVILLRPREFGSRDDQIVFGDLAIMRAHFAVCGELGALQTFVRQFAVASGPVECIWHDRSDLRYCRWRLACFRRSLGRPLQLHPANRSRQPPQ
jgi:hypothetical protein